MTMFTASILFTDICLLWCYMCLLLSYGFKPISALSESSDGKKDLVQPNERHYAGIPKFIRQPLPKYYVNKTHPATIVCEAEPVSHVNIFCADKEYSYMGQPVSRSGLRVEILDLVTTDNKGDRSGASPGEVAVGSRDGSVGTGRRGTADSMSRGKRWRFSLKVRLRDVLEWFSEYKCYCEAWNQIIEINKAKKVHSSPALVQESYFQDTFQKYPQSKTVRPGDRVELPCTPPDAKPPATVYWLKDNEVLSTSKNPFIIIDKFNSLLIEKFRSTDSGNYTCAATSLGTVKYSSSANIILTDSEWKQWSDWSISCTPHCMQTRIRVCRTSICNGLRSEGRNCSWDICSLKGENGGSKSNEVGLEKTSMYLGLFITIAILFAIILLILLLITRRGCIPILLARRSMNFSNPPSGWCCVKSKYGDKSSAHGSKNEKLLIGSSELPQVTIKNPNVGATPSGTHHRGSQSRNTLLEQILRTSTTFSDSTRRPVSGGTNYSPVYEMHPSSQSEMTNNLIQPALYSEFPPNIIDANSTSNNNNNNNNSNSNSNNNKDNNNNSNNSIHSNSNNINNNNNNNNSHNLNNNTLNTINNNNNNNNNNSNNSNNNLRNQKSSPYHHTANTPLIGNDVTPNRSPGEVGSCSSNHNHNHSNSSNNEMKSRASSALYQELSLSRVGLCSQFMSYLPMDDIDLDTVAWARLSHASGRLCLPKSGISLTIPHNSLLPGSPEEMFLAVCRDQISIPVLDSKEMLISPVTLCGPPTVQLNKSLIISLPHCAYVQGDSSWNIRILYARYQNNQIPPLWKELTTVRPLNQSDSHTYCQLDSSRAQIIIDHPQMICLVGKWLPTISPTKDISVRLVVLAFLQPNDNDWNDVIECNVNVKSAGQRIIKVHVVLDTKEAVFNLTSRELSQNCLLLDECDLVFSYRSGDLALNVNDTLLAGWRCRSGSKTQNISTVSIWKLTHTTSVESKVILDPVNPKKSIVRRNGANATVGANLGQGCYITLHQTEQHSNQGMLHILLDQLIPPPTTPSNNIGIAKYPKQILSTECEFNPSSLDPIRPIFRISYEARQKLWPLLDLSWQIFANHIGLNGNLNYFSEKQSPSDSILDLWEARNREETATFDLINTMSLIGRNDCAIIVEQDLLK